jgi:hypothetical protein
MQNNLLKPRIIEVEPLGAGHAKVVMEPFERGYGHTLGNALRRVLLSSMVGYAPTEVTIAGVVHEYSSLDGVQEDVVDILLNLKGVVFKLHNRDDVTLTLKKEGEGAVLASDIDLPHDVELINPDHVIAHLTPGGKLDMQVKVEKGRGYVPGNVRRLAEDANKTIGRIILDASFSPVRRVSYAVESARVEGRSLIERVRWAKDVEENHLARLGWKMTLGGFLKAVSVGFFPTKWARNGGDGFQAACAEIGLKPENAKDVRAIYLEQEQIELSACIIGANPNALAKSFAAGCIGDADLASVGFDDGDMQFLKDVTPLLEREDIPQIERILIGREIDGEVVLPIERAVAVARRSVVALIARMDHSLVMRVHRVPPMAASARPTSCHTARSTTSCRRPAARALPRGSDSWAP